jgi:hypothetical protein
MGYLPVGLDHWAVSFVNVASCLCPDSFTADLGWVQFLERLLFDLIRLF